MGPHGWAETLRFRYVRYSIKVPRVEGLGQICDQTHWIVNNGQGLPFTFYSMKKDPRTLKGI